MLHHIASLPRRLRWAMHRWNPVDDRAFHDTLFGQQDYDPFTFAYPGYVTIRRFADVAADRLDDARRVVDLGCGPGEITCELARRFPGVSFTGVDHSAAAIERARTHAAALGLANITFAAADISAWRPAEPVDVVLMFDAFHHLLDPAGFVARSRDLTDRFVLVEPAGDWLGGWQKNIDLDWIPLAVDSIRARLAWQLGVPASAPGSRPLPSAAEGAPVEHRYTIGDLQRFFDGFGLDLRGTVAGLETYPPDAYESVPFRKEFGHFAYDLLAALDRRLFELNLDLHAKHWVVHARRGLAGSVRTPRPLPTPAGSNADELRGPYDVEFLGYDGGTQAQPNREVVANVTFRNRSFRPWSSASEPPVMMSYHWMGARGDVAEQDGLRTPLPRTVVPGETCTMSVRVQPPQARGRYTLALDLVEEGVTWFSRAGAATCRVQVDVGR